MEAFYFGEGNDKLFGAYHNANFKKDKQIGVILCYPFGQEYIRCHKAYLILAKELAANGIHTLRFDFFGCGDSEGQLEDASINIWLNNIQTAINELRNGSDVKKIVLVGARFGATLATIFSSKNNIDGLVLWSPIINGINYNLELRKYHKDWLSGSFSKKTTVPPNLEMECLGFPITKDFFKELNEININILAHNQNTKYLLVESKEKVSADFIDRFSQIEIKESTSHDFWLKQEDENNKSLVPIKEINLIVEWICNLN